MWCRLQSNYIVESKGGRKRMVGLIRARVMGRVDRENWEIKGNLNHLSEKYKKHKFLLETVSTKDFLILGQPKF